MIFVSSCSDKMIWPNKNKKDYCKTGNAHKAKSPIHTYSCVDLPLSIRHSECRREGEVKKRTGIFPCMD